MAELQPTDEILVNRNGIDYKLSVSDIEDKLQETDEVLINRGGVDYKVSGWDLKEYLDLNPPPWESECGIYHVIVDDPADIVVQNQAAIYNLDTEQQVSSITAAGEWIVAGPDTVFQDSPGNWQFGDLTDTRCVTNMHSMFRNARAFNSDIGNWNVGNVTDMTKMFALAEAFNKDISNWDVSNVTCMFDMFHNARVFNSDISNWDVSNVTQVTWMFYGAWEFNSDISNWDVSSVTDMSYMFWDAISFNQNIGDWDVSSVTDMECFAFVDNVYRSHDFFLTLF